MPDPDPSGAATPLPELPEGYAPVGMPEELKLRLREVFILTRARQIGNTASTLAATAAPRELAENVVGDAFHLTGNLVAASPALEQYQCGRGCSWCCHQQVLISAPEAIAIADALREAYPPEWIATLRRVLAQRVALIAELATPRAYLEAAVPCAFLAPDGGCAVYERRPIVCRGYHSLSRSACQEKYIDLKSPAPPIDSYAHMASNAVMHGVQAAVAASGRDGGAYELHGAVLRALEAPDAAARWAGGERLFADGSAVGT
jgi:Fe-S-cluster containining protein